MSQPKTGLFDTGWKPAPLDEQFMRQAIRLAMNGRGRVEPNPMVGCVIVKDGRVIGEGFHARFGGPHAEPAALANCTEPPAGATAYVTLEPCCHTNKKTPPCAPRLIEAKLARVVIGCLDPNPEVNGKGVAMLREAGIQVDGPLLEGPAKQLIAPFIAWVVHRRPYVTLKWAESADRKVAGAHGRRTQISAAEARDLIHLLRSRCDAILIGAATMRNDDPLLTARGIPHPRTSIRAVLSTRWIEVSPQLLSTASEASPVLLYCSHEETADHPGLGRKPAEGGVIVVRVDPDARGRPSLHNVLADLGSRGARQVMVEPGPTLARSFFDAGLADRTWVIRSQRAINEPTAPEAAEVPASYVYVRSIELGGDILTEYLDPASPTYFAPEPSADMVRMGESFV